MSSPLAVVIPAGGGGTRLWPRSRQDTPKQFLDIVTPGRTMLQETVDRVSPSLVPVDNVFVITNARHAETAAAQLPDTPRANIVGEPMGRDSAPAIGLMAALLEQRLGGDALMIVLPADHVILDVHGFRRALRLAEDAAKNGYLVTLGIPPTSPDTGFGYIQRGEALGSGDVFTVRQFREKPDIYTARQYVRSGDFYWNAGMFIATVDTFRQLYKRFLPDLEAPFAALIESIGTETEAETFAAEFPKLTKISFDYAIAEKAAKVAVVPANIGWNDVGSWTRLADVLAGKADENGSVTFGKVHAIRSVNSLVYCPTKIVALIGLDDVVIVDTPDALLVAHRNRSEDVKKVVDQLIAEGRKDLL